MDEKNPGHCMACDYTTDRLTRHDSLFNEEGLWLCDICNETHTGTSMMPELAPELVQHRPVLQTMSYQHNVVMAQLARIASKLGSA